MPNARRSPASSAPSAAVRGLGYGADVLLLAILALARADDVPSGEAAPAPTAPAAPAPASPTGAEAAPATQPPPLAAKVAGEEIEVREAQEVLRKRAELFEALVQEGYVRRRRQGDDRTVFLSEDPWKPQVIVHDDGWVYFRRQPPRIHAPGRSFADQGSPAAYLLCIIAPTSCISIGGWLVSDRKLSNVQGEVLVETQAKIRAMNDVVARRELSRRLNDDIPRDLEAVWARADLSDAGRKILLFEYWDARTDTPEGDAAKGAIEAFLRGVVQQSDTPYTADELAGLNAKRQSRAALDLSPRALDPMDVPAEPAARAEPPAPTAPAE